MKLSIIAAISGDGFLADASGRIPWHMPRDIAHFRHQCAGKHLLIGRKTADQMRGWFLEMEATGMTVHPLILTRSASQAASKPPLVSSVSEAIGMTQEIGAEELLVCGGAEVYEHCLPLAQTLILTTVHCRVFSGVKFPAFSETEWSLAKRRSWDQDANHAHKMEICEYHRKRQGQDLEI